MNVFVFASRVSKLHIAMGLAALAVLAHLLTGMSHFWLGVLAFGACGVATRYVLEHRRVKQTVEVLRWMDSPARRR